MLVYLTNRIQQTLVMILNIKVNRKKQRHAKEPTQYLRSNHKPQRREGAIRRREAQHTDFCFANRLLADKDGERVYERAQSGLYEGVGDGRLG